MYSLRVWLKRFLFDWFSEFPFSCRSITIQNVNIIQEYQNIIPAFIGVRANLFSGIMHFVMIRLQYRISMSCGNLAMGRRMTKPINVRPANTQISLGIRPVWSETSLCAQWVAMDPSFLHADSEDSDRTRQMNRLIWVIAGRTFIGFVMRRLIAKFPQDMEIRYCRRIITKCIVPENKFALTPMKAGMIFWLVLSWGGSNSKE